MGKAHFLVQKIPKQSKIDLKSCSLKANLILDKIR